MKLSQILLTGVASMGLILAWRSSAAAHCGDGVTTVGEACDAGTAVCSGGKNAGSECTRASDCQGGGTCGCGAGSTCINGVGNRDDIPNACRATCMLPMCGDGVSDAGEQCDDGASNSLNGPCKPPYSACEGGLREGLPCTTNADCGAPAPLPNGLCKPNAGCLLNVCGDGLLCSQAGCPIVRVDLLTQRFAPEQCDDGNTNDMDACLSNGATAAIGDKVFTVSCASNICGDGITNMGVEDCDDGGAVCITGPKSGKPCCTDMDCFSGSVPGVCSGAGGATNIAGFDNRGDRQNCLDPVTGQPAPGGHITCHCSCTLPFCGDGISDSLGGDCVVGLNPLTGKNDDEGCEDGTQVNGPGRFCNKVKRCMGGENPGVLCTQASDCTKGMCGKIQCEQNKCGDGTVAGLEQCDDGNTVEASGATDTCGVDGSLTDPNTVCGSMTAASGCDPALPQNVPGSCIPCACRLPFCGDGVTNPGEMCDAGTGQCSVDSYNPGSPCSRASQCKNLPGILGDQCGPGLWGPGNRDDVRDRCRSNCMPPGCGDGVVDTGEQCDTGAANGPTKPCTSVCTPATCGDGQVCSDPACTSGPNGGPEQCDDGNAVDPTATNGDVCGGSLVGSPDIAPCAAAKCGDGVTNPGEQCDSMSMGCSNMKENLSPPEQAFDCCIDGNVVEGSLAGQAPGLLSVEQGLTALIGCRLPSLIARTACDPGLQRLLLQIQARVQAGEVYLENDDITRARRLLLTAEKRLNRLTRRVARATRVGGPCAANRQAITNQKADAANLIGGVVATLTEDATPFGP